MPSAPEQTHLKRLVQFFFSALFSLQLSYSAEQADSAVAVAVKVGKPPSLGGILTDETWNKAAPITNFIQRELHEGMPATERTEVRIVYDDNAIYVGVWCYDSVSHEIVANEMQRDFNTDVEDNFKVIIDTYHDKRNGFLFIINPNGARYDALVTDEGQGVNSDWNGLWNARTTTTPQGWFAVIEIPFSTLRFPDGAKQIWGINFERNIRRKREQDLWQGYSRNFTIEKLSQAGILTGLENVHRGNRVEVKPYVLGGVEKGYPPFSDVSSTQTKIGLDINYGLTSTLTLDVTTNTDFAQVEADRVHINLTRFPLFYPEKRDFFLEGAGIFDFQFGDSPIPFYSRRIGLSDAGEAIPILGGVRVVGKAGQYNLGMLTMQTAESAGEPTTNYTVARVKRDLLQQSYLGVIATNKQSSSSYNRLLGFDGAWVQSDVFGTNTLIIGGGIAGTEDPGITTNNLAYRLYADFPNDLIDQFIGVRVVQRNFDPQVGFQNRNDFVKYSYTFRVRARPQGIGIQYIEFKPIEMNYYKGTNGEVQSLDYEGRILGFQTNSGEYFEWNIQRFADTPHDSIEFFGNKIPPSTYWWSRWELQFATNDSRNASLFLLYRWGGHYNGNRRTYIIQPQLKLGGRFSLSLDYTRNEVRLPMSDFTANEAGATINYGFSPMLNSSLLIQWNNEDNEISMNLRLHWIPQIGSDIYLVVNQLFDTSGRILQSKTTIIAKAAYLFVL
ncbi:MAG: carbohydrate binding family 9 domain-containing protein [Ignavibacteriae bacterium]|nr:carbohydrate binding family 9 domain-containing protein [Ignavibacteria bacterium]MBI3365957.1 carbohydrate binding family 9 domain-containing protein [Ignavibacteriota bacterium]